MPVSGITSLLADVFIAAVTAVFLVVMMIMAGRCCHRRQRM
jgi:hypothetical protein